MSGSAYRRASSTDRPIDEVVETTALRAMYEVRSVHDFTAEPRPIALDADESLLAALANGEGPG